MPTLGVFGADHDSYLPHLALAAAAAGVVARETDGAVVARACRADLAGKKSRSQRRRWRLAATCGALVACAAAQAHAAAPR